MAANNSIVDFLNSTGQKSDYNTRATLAKSNGINNYTGTAEQNINLLGILSKTKAPTTAAPTPTTTVVKTPTTTAVTTTKPPQNISEANTMINANQQSNFDSATKTNEPETRSSAYNNAFNDLKSTLATDLPAKSDVVSLKDSFNALRGSYGVTDLENNLTELKTQARDIQAMSKARTNAEKNKAVPMNVIAGRVSEEEQQDNERLTTINNSIQTLTDQLNSKYSVIDNIMKYTAADYDNAVQDYDKQFAQNISIFNATKGIVDDQKSDEERVVDNARANAQIMINTMQSNGTTYDQLSPDQQTNLTKLGVQSGLGANFFTDVMKTSAGKEILTTITNDDKTKTTIMYKDGTTKVISTGLPAGSGVQPKSGPSAKTYKSGSLTYSDKDVGEDAAALQKYVGTDGYVDANVYYQAYKVWVQQGGLAKDFVSNFPPNQYVNPSNKSLPSYLQNTSKASGRDNG